jgi:hypothetical protein
VITQTNATKHKCMQANTMLALPAAVLGDRCIHTVSTVHSVISLDPGDWKTECPGRRPEAWAMLREP